MAFMSAQAREKLDAMRLSNEALGEGTQTALVVSGRLRVKTVYSGVVECEKTEEYDVKTDELLLRKWRQMRTLGGFSPYSIEIGEGNPRQSAAVGLAVSSRNPVFIPRDTREAFQFRVRNIPYPREVYQVTVDSDRDQIVLRTTNKKYFKRFDIPALKRFEIPLDKSDISYYHENNALIIMYAKPQKIRIAEEHARLARAKAPKKDGQIDQSSCKQQ